MTLFFDSWEDMFLPQQAIADDFHIQLLGIGFGYDFGISAKASLGDGLLATAPNSKLAHQTTSDWADQAFATGEEFSTPGAADDNGGEIVVTGERVQKYVLPDWWYANGGGDGSAGWIDGSSGGGGSGGTSTELPDEASIDVTLSFDRPLTSSEEEGLDNLKTSIEKITAAINALADDAILTLPNGANVTGAELKVIWSMTDFVINDNATYDNGTQGGEAKMHFGQPTISLNIQYLDAFDDSVGGMNYLIAHELGHLSQAGTSYYTDQRTANDIARALLAGANLAYLNPEPTFGYTGTAPMQFSDPPDSTGGGSGGGGTYDEPIT